MEKRCYIVGAGEFCENELPGQSDYVIAADGGYAALLSNGITPDMVIGDFDSLDADLLDTLSKHPNVVRYYAEKDDTDTMLAVKHGLELGFKAFIINGGLGGRLDHTLANIQVLVYIAENDACGTLIGNGYFVTAIKDGTIELTPGTEQGGTVSIFSFGGNAEGVTLKGLKYTLENATFTCNYPMGVSNEFKNEPATISVDKGTLIIVVFQT